MCLCRNTQSKWDGSKRWLLADGLGSVFKMVCVSHVSREFGLVRVPHWALPSSSPSPKNRRRRREKTFLLRRESVEQTRRSVLSGRAFHSPWGSLAFPTSTLSLGVQIVPVGRGIPPRTWVLLELSTWPGFLENQLM